jgi:hypothetical protein
MAWGEKAPDQRAAGPARSDGGTEFASPAAPFASHRFAWPLPFGPVQVRLSAT